ncbi:uncharacterized protein LOC132920081 [Rhopalosiphum padi]|uniref:uncharacterized protein LOC132920081 n=1 Tax=Rhopalosiphum padi TaxID=40932 RepID=UPI00298E9D1C|nr:uncharacterized protein LOC132920081 [Rhopalosiphum padi]XP_060838140.1 uncharacterized protein LOC132920081 [Rhopalosiphum padi]XP_060838149.1 uncharacterized protein LOC132920081 [Rhopalosiphum padi]XP_060838157.1 uncharacterized protein LOC132920081 [Rhopalosiphum padi]
MSKHQEMECPPAANFDADEDEWKKMSLTSKAAFVARNVSVEPMLGVFQLSMIMSSLTTQNLNMQKACRVNLNLDQTVCFALENKNATSFPAEEVAVQKMVTKMMLWQNLFQNIIPCVLVMFVGSWSDRNRKRKPFMLLPIIGELVRNIGLIACVYFFYELPMEIAGIVETVPSAVSGGLPVLILAVFAYVGDISTVKNRTVRVGFVSLFFSISVTFGSALSGIVFRDYGFYGVYIISTALYLFSFIYCLIVIKDIKPDVEKCHGPHIAVEHCKKSFILEITDFFDLKHVKEAIRVTFKRRNDDNRRNDIILLFVIMVIILGPLSGEQTLMYLLVRVKFGWNEVDFSVFSTYYFICNLVGIGFSLWILVNRLGIDDRLIGAIGCLSKGLASFVYAFAPTEFLFYLGPIVDIFHGTALVAFRAILSKLVPANQLGQALAVSSLVETIIPAIFRPLYSVIYYKTLHNMPGAFYVFGGVLNIFGIFVFISMYKKKKQNEKCEYVEEKQALSAKPRSEHP